MKKNNRYEFACNTRSHYVRDKYLQVILPYRKDIDVVDGQGLIFHRKEGSDLTINKYLNDERKEEFPYSNIPEYKMITPRGIIRCTNQLLEFNKPYIIITGGIILEKYAVKNNDNAILITKCILPQKEEKTLTLDELRKLVYSADSIEKKFSLGGGIYANNQLLPEETEIIKKIRDFFFEQYTIIDYGQLISDWGKIKLKESANLNDSLWNFIKDNYPLKNILNVYTPIILNGCVIVYKDDNGISSVKAIEATMKDIGTYQTNIYDFPITHYSLEEAKLILEADKNRTAKEPKISRILNRDIDKRLIREEKARVKRLTKKFDF